MSMNTSALLNDNQHLSFDIPSSRLSEVMARIDVLNRKCSKLNLPPITIEKSREVVKRVHDEDTSGLCSNDREVLFTPVVITFHPVKVVGNHKFCAAITHEIVNGQNHNIVQGYGLTPEMELAYRHVPSECGHCKVQRNRNKTFIILNLDNDTSIQVGSSCVNDFFATNVEAAILSIDIAAEIASFGDEDEYGSCRGGVQLTSLRETVAYSVAQIRQHGFISASKAKEANDYGDYSVRSTASVVMFEMNPPKEIKKEDLLVVLPSDYETGAEIIAKWEKELVPMLDNNSDVMDTFTYKIAIVVALGHVKSKYHAIVVGAVGYAMRKAAEALAPKQTVLNEYLPNVKEKEKVELLLTVLRSFVSEGNYGSTTIITFLDSAGHAITWFASGLKNEEFAVGNTYKIKATIKGFQDSQKYGKSTIIQRAKIID
jgi:hypothetical protein